MAATKVTSIYYTCDAQGCKNCGGGEGMKIPVDWRYVQCYPPHNRKGEANPSDFLALLCNDCAGKLRLFFTKTLKPREQKETEEEKNG